MTDVNRLCALAVVKALKARKPRGMAAKQAVMDQVMAQHPGSNEHRVRAEVERMINTRTR